jgi:hypothetical protein
MGGQCWSATDRDKPNCAEIIVLQFIFYSSGWVEYVFVIEVQIRTEESAVYLGNSLP